MAARRSAAQRLAGSCAHGDGGRRGVAASCGDAVQQETQRRQAACCGCGAQRTAQRRRVATLLRPARLQEDAQYVHVAFRRGGNERPGSRVRRCAAGGIQQQLRDTHALCARRHLQPAQAAVCLGVRAEPATQQQPQRIHGITGCAHVHQRAAVICDCNVRAGRTRLERARHCCGVARLNGSDERRGEPLLARQVFSSGESRVSDAHLRVCLFRSCLLLLGSLLGICIFHSGLDAVAATREGVHYWEREHGNHKEERISGALADAQRIFATKKERYQSTLRMKWSTPPRKRQNCVMTHSRGLKTKPQTP
jgi:hypothetical protein